MAMMVMMAIIGMMMVMMLMMLMMVYFEETWREERDAGPSRVDSGRVSPSHNNDDDVEDYTVIILSAWV